jgi:hypothetical protein
VRRRDVLLGLVQRAERRLDGSVVGDVGTRRRPSVTGTTDSARSRRCRARPGRAASAASRPDPRSRRRCRRQNSAGTPDKSPPPATTRPPSILLVCLGSSF